MGKLGEVLRHPDEAVPLLAMYIAAKRTQILPKDPGLRFCYDMLNRVSRSFAVVIQQLPERLRDAVCVFYLVLRALDTVEDDMSIPEDVKVPLLRCFHEKSRQRGWTMECGTGHYADLMTNYGLVTDVFLTLDTEYQRVIEDICKKMGNGMADFITTEVDSVEQYNLYCHYVAGLVGVGLSQLFASSGLENASYFKKDRLSNEMGLFLQKTNIIRDYLEDICEEPAPRMFWPREIWGQHAQQLEDFKLQSHRESALACLNHMIMDALGHAENCLEYMSTLRCPAIFRFCAIPQVMAAGTLAACLNNPNVFTGVVKMRRGETAKIWWRMEDFADCCVLFKLYAREMSIKAQAQARKDPNLEALLDACNRMEAAATRHLLAAGRSHEAQKQAELTAVLPLSSRLLLLVLALMYCSYAFHLGQIRELMGLPHRAHMTSMDSLNQATAIILLCYAIVVGITGRRMAS